MSIKIHDLKRIKKRVRLKKIPYPKKLEAEYYRELKQIAEAMKHIVMERLLPALKSKENEYTNDGIIDDIMMMFESLRNSGGVKNAIQIASEMVRKTDNLNREKVLQQLNQKLGVDLPTTFAKEGIEPIIKANIAKNATLIKSIPEEFVKNIESIIYSGVTTGATYKSIEEQIKGTEGIKSVFGKLDDRIKLIARNEVSSINGQINKVRMQNIGVTKFEWVTAGDERVRDSHADLDGQVFDWNNPPTNERGEKIIPGQDFNCFPYESKLQIPCAINRLYRRVYHGELITLITSNGSPLRGTPNHPVLTMSGWKSLDSIEIGDDIINIKIDGSFVPFVGLPSRDTYNNNSAPTIGDFFESFCVFFGLHTGIQVSHNFHGDGVINEDVDIINIDSKLADTIKTVFSEGFDYDTFSKAMSNSFCELSCFRSCQEFILSSTPSSNGIMSFLNECESFIIREISHPNEISLRAISALNSASIEFGINGFSWNTKFIKEFECAISGNVSSAQFVTINLFRIWCGAIMSNWAMPSLSHFDAEIAPFTIKNLSNLPDIESVNIESYRIIDKIISIESLHVYNLETKLGWYYAENYTVKNCRCQSIAVIEPFKEIEE